MSSKKLRRVGLSPELCDRLSRYQIVNCQHFLSLSPLELMKVTGLSYRGVHELLHTVSKACAPQMQTAYELKTRRSAHLSPAFLSTTLCALDEALHGGVPCGSLTEITGPPGCGKTQFCIMMSVLATLPTSLGGLEGAVVYIDTESAFTAERLVEIAESRFPQYFNTEEKLLLTSSRVHLCRELTCEGLLQRLESLEEEIISKGVKLVIVDSIASVVRKEFDPKLQGNIKERNKFLGKGASLLKYLAGEFSIPMTGNNFWLKKIEISVSEAEKRTGRNAVNMQETYTAYLIETRSVEHADGQSVLTDSLWRRYSEFELLRNYLLVYYPHVVVPPLPEKRAEFVWHKLSADNMDPDFVERRRVGLENFLLRVASHPVLCRDKIFYSFLTQEGNWKETVNETGFQLKADSRLKALNATFRVKNPDKRFTELRHYSDELQSVISHLLRVRARVADRLYGVYKVHGNYGRVFSEWSAIEKEMGDGLQSAGHHMDVYASSIDDILEDEEHYADQLKEYLFYAEALRAVCRKHELMQYDLETAAQDLAAKKQQCEELATGTVRTFSLKGMTTKLFGQETPEQREARIKVLEEQINEGEQQLKSKNLEGREFVKNAWADIERFKEQKNRDLKEALISYAVMQISMCKKGIQVWTNAKECFSKM